MEAATELTELCQREENTAAGGTQSMHPGYRFFTKCEPNVLLSVQKCILSKLMKSYEGQTSVPLCS